MGQTGGCLAHGHRTRSRDLELVTVTSKVTPKLGTRVRRARTATEVKIRFVRADDVQQECCAAALGKGSLDYKLEDLGFAPRALYARLVRELDDRT